MPITPTLIVVGLSARALSASARNAGLAPLAIDVFGDEDTIALSEAMIRLEGGLAAGLARARVVEAVASMASRYRPIGLIYGSGFEDRPETLEAVSEFTPILGNRADVVARVKDPLSFARLCVEIGIAHPEIAANEPPSREGWLRKRRGGSGGAHVAPARDGSTDEHEYFQRRVSGAPFSALFLADGMRAKIVGFSAQWAAPTPEQPFRFGGACGPPPLDAASATKMVHAVEEVARRLGLVGLNGADFLVTPDETWLIEINPRSGAALELFESARAPLMAAHLEACAGRLKTLLPKRGFTAIETVYASLDMRTRAGFTWPQWAADRPAAGARIARGEPFCTVTAQGRTFAEARGLAERRSAEIAALAGEAEL
jgi:predicted ATP-grasp superfamily ATP-dependent carboligase